jgi:hypothetical protein
MSRTDHIVVLPSQKYLRECFTVKRNGKLFWKRSRPAEHFVNSNMHAIWKNRCAGKLAGVAHLGYRDIGLDGKRYRAHRIIWKMVTGEEPPKILDHADRDKTNSRFKNLRAASSSQSACNKNLRKDNISGLKGVYPHTWVAQIATKGAHFYLGVFKSKEEAHAAYQTAARKLHGRFSS